jgi:hypothetical protein
MSHTPRRRTVRFTAGAPTPTTYTAWSCALSCLSRSSWARSPVQWQAPTTPTSSNRTAASGATVAMPPASWVSARPIPASIRLRCKWARASPGSASPRQTAPCTPSAAITRSGPAAPMATASSGMAPPPPAPRSCRSARMRTGATSSMPTPSPTPSRPMARFGPGGPTHSTSWGMAPPLNAISRSRSGRIPTGAWSLAPRAPPPLSPQA